MKMCPIAIAVGCAKCPAFKICPAKAAIGGWKPEAPKPADARQKEKAPHA